MRAWLSNMVLVAGMTAATVVSAGTPADARWWDRHTEGWFWYRDPPKPPPDTKPEPPEKEEAPRVVVMTPPREASGENREKPPLLSAAWLKANLPRYLMRALDEPTPENVRTYLYLQRVAMDKASHFTDAMQTAVVGDPMLDEYASFPTGTRLGQSMMRLADTQREQMLNRLAKSSGVFFFYDGACRECALQLGVLDTLKRRHGFTVMLVSLDGSPPPGAPDRPYRVDRGQARQLGIARGPALVLARPPQGLAPLAHGLMPIRELRRRILLVASREGWINKGWYDETRPAWVADLDVSDWQGALPEDVRAVLALDGGFEQ